MTKHDLKNYKLALKRFIDAKMTEFFVELLHDDFERTAAKVSRALTQPNRDDVEAFNDALNLLRASSYGNIPILSLKDLVTYSKFYLKGGKASHYLSKTTNNNAQNNSEIDKGDWDFELDFKSWDTANKPIKYSEAVNLVDAAQVAVIMAAKHLNNLLDDYDIWTHPDKFDPLITTFLNKYLNIKTDASVPTSIYSKFIENIDILTLSSKTSIRNDCHGVLLNIINNSGQPNSHDTRQKAIYFFLNFYVPILISTFDVKEDTIDKTLNDNIHSLSATLVEPRYNHSLIGEDKKHYIFSDFIFDRSVLYDPFTHKNLNEQPAQRSITITNDKRQKSLIASSYSNFTIPHFTLSRTVLGFKYKMLLCDTNDTSNCNTDDPKNYTYIYFKSEVLDIASRRRGVPDESARQPVDLKPTTVKYDCQENEDLPVPLIFNLPSSYYHMFENSSLFAEIQHDISMSPHKSEKRVDRMKANHKHLLDHLCHTCRQTYMDEDEVKYKVNCIINKILLPFANSQSNNGSVQFNQNRFNINTQNVFYQYQSYRLEQQLVNSDDSLDTLKSLILGPTTHYEQFQDLSPQLALNWINSNITNIRTLNSDEPILVQLDLFTYLAVKSGNSSLLSPYNAIEIGINRKIFEYLFNTVTTRETALNSFDSIASQPYYPHLTNFDTYFYSTSEYDLNHQNYCEGHNRKTSILTINCLVPISSSQLAPCPTSLVLYPLEDTDKHASSKSLSNLNLIKYQNMHDFANPNPNTPNIDNPDLLINFVKLARNTLYSVRSLGRLKFMIDTLRQN
ncbi:hypothetical protein [Candidatus Albibeggiatoa sp. nov. NOAA]|uniref:hypothetical protein n=1 Tax=Candidatus Albibeggiatoa sp. nov. NOAA TaxID=3162724 RepID=UPI0032FB7066|nr:hypothetical protein [Thiotrichaceae bacterium]